MKALDRKLLRDLWQLRSQAFTIAMVVASGIAGFIGSLSTSDSLQWLRQSFYEEGRFAHVFAVLKRAPKAVERRIAELPGVADVGNDGGLRRPARHSQRCRAYGRAHDRRRQWRDAAAQSTGHPRRPRPSIPARRAKY